MSPLDSFDHPLTGRYASPEMQRLFSTGHRYKTWRRMWLALAEAERELGLDIPAEAIEQMRANLELTEDDLVRVAEYEKRTRHDVMAHLEAFADRAPAARPILHLGATSAFVGDNAELVITRDALDLVIVRVLAVIDALAIFAEKWADEPTLGMTHFQPAQPTTVGKRATLWLQDFLLDLERLRFERSRLKLRGAKGTTGTQATFLELFDGDHAKVRELDRLVAAKMGFDSHLRGHRPDLPAQGRRLRARRPVRGRPVLRQARHRYPAAGPAQGGARTARRGPGGIVGHALQGQPDAVGAGDRARPLAHQPGRQPGADGGLAVARAHSRRLCQPTHGAARGLPLRRRHPAGGPQRGRRAQSLSCNGAEKPRRGAALDGLRGDPYGGRAPRRRPPGAPRKIAPSLTRIGEDRPGRRRRQPVPRSRGRGP